MNMMSPLLERIKFKIERQVSNELHKAEFQDVDVSYSIDYGYITFFIRACRSPQLRFIEATINLGIKEIKKQERDSEMTWFHYEFIIAKRVAAGFLHCFWKMEKQWWENKFRRMME